MIKRYILPTTVIIAIIASTFSIYQFYFKSRLTEYRENINRQDQLEARLVELEEKFEGTKPEDMVKAERAEVGPLLEAVDRRARFFRTPEIEETPIPEKGLFKFIYADEYADKFRELEEYAYTRNPPVYLPPTTFGAPDPESIQVPKRSEVVKWLRDIDYGKSRLKRLVDAGAQEIYEFEIWPKRTQYGLLEMNSLGLYFTMTLRNFVNYMEGLRTENRYLTVEALQIQNRSLRTYAEPLLDIRLILTEARYNVGEGGPGGTLGAGGASDSIGDIFSQLKLGNTAFQASARAKKDELGIFGKAWKWFKRNILYISG